MPGALKSQFRAVWAFSMLMAMFAAAPTSDVMGMTPVREDSPPQGRSSLQAPQPGSRSFPVIRGYHPGKSPFIVDENVRDQLIVIRRTELGRLAFATKEEEQLMADVVRPLDRVSAARWLDGFISSKPFGCPPARRPMWVEAMIDAVERNEILLCKEILGLVACIISIESSFMADPLAVDPSSGEDMGALLSRAEQQFMEKVGPIFSMPPIPTLYDTYKERYFPQLLGCRTEGDVEAVARCIADDLRRDAQGLPAILKERVMRGADKLVNVVRTKGSMQLNFTRARQVMTDRGEQFTPQELCDYMYTVKGGVDVGVAALKPMFVQYAARYGTPGDLSWLFFVGMDYHYGPFSSRNMMEQLRIRDLSGQAIPVDGDLLGYDEDGIPLPQESLTLRAARLFLNPTSREELYQAFLLEKDPHYIYTDAHRRLAEAHL
ncbi:MAG: DUF1615 domain-containing protein, partial [Desulfomonile sp.]|nr:DUF1615 domain-containing protein [Desulfomonile sp.]